MKAYSLDLGEEDRRVVKNGRPKSETARRFGVTERQSRRYWQKAREPGTLEPSRLRKALKLDEKAMRLLAKTSKKGLWLPIPRGSSSLRRVGCESGSEATLCRAGNTPLHSRKKSSRAAAERDDFLSDSGAWRSAQPRSGRLVFVTRMALTLPLAPLYTYAPVGERAFFEIPRNCANNTTLLSKSNSIQKDGTFDGRRRSDHQGVFEAYAEHLLAPPPSGRVSFVVMDNLVCPQPKPKRIR